MNDEFLRALFNKLKELLIEQEEVERQLEAVDVLIKKYVAMKMEVTNNA